MFVGVIHNFVCYYYVVLCGHVIVTWRICLLYAISDYFGHFDVFYFLD